MGNQLSKYKGLNLVYANQCPLFIKSVDEMKTTAKEFGLELKVSILDSAKKAQQAPSGYGVYSLFMMENYFQIIIFLIQIQKYYSKEIL